MSRLPWILALAFLAACSASEVDTQNVEQRIERQLGRQVNDAVSVKCPSGLEWETGRDFHCIVVDSAGTRARVTVSMENDDGAFSWAVD